jgi:hypothetical protein
MTAWGYDALADYAAVTVIMVMTPPFMIARANAGLERANPHANVLRGGRGHDSKRCNCCRVRFSGISIETHANALAFQAGEAGFVRTAGTLSYLNASRAVRPMILSPSVRARRLWDNRKTTAQRQQHPVKPCGGRAGASARPGRLGVTAAPFCVTLPRHGRGAAAGSSSGMARARAQNVGPRCQSTGSISANCGLSPSLTQPGCSPRCIRDNGRLPQGDDGQFEYKIKHSSEAHEPRKVS